MNEPIISPWVFYWIGMLDKLYILPLVTMLFSTVVMVIAVFLYEDVPGIRCKWGKCCFMTILISFVISFFAPTKETAYKMLIAQQVTPQNVEIAKDNVVRVVDAGVDKLVKIIEAFNRR